MRQNMATPSSVRKLPDTICCTLIIRRSLSAWLFMMAKRIDDIQCLFVRPDDLRSAKGNPNISCMDIHIGASPCAKYFALYSALAAFTPTCIRIPSEDEVAPSPQADESGAARTKLSRFASAASNVSSRICQSMDQESWR